MRPSTLAEAVERIMSGEPREVAFAGFLDHFYTRAGKGARSDSLRDEPAWTGEARLDALAGAMAEYLAKQYDADIPRWAGDRRRYLDEPWFTVEKPAPGMIEYLVHVSPAEFRSRNIFTEGAPLRRASQRRRDPEPVQPTSTTAPVSGQL